MKAITASWMISCALLCGCGASSGDSEGENVLGSQPNTPANDSYEDGNQEKPSPSNEFHPPCVHVPSKDIPLIPSYPDPEKDAGSSGEEGNPGMPQSKGLPTR